MERQSEHLADSEYDMGHEINSQNLMELSTWLQEKILSPIVLA